MYTFIPSFLKTGIKTQNMFSDLFRRDDPKVLLVHVTMTVQEFLTSDLIFDLESLTRLS